MKTYCSPEIRQAIIASAKPIDSLYNLRVDYNGVRLIDIPYPTEIVQKSFDCIRKELDIHDGDEHGINLVVYKVIDGPAKDHYLFHEYNHGSCSECDYYSSTLSKLCFIPDHKIDDAINDCRMFINYIIRSIKLVEPGRIKEFIIDNYAYRWENDDESSMLKLLEHFNISL
jgi:hypothetical protein